MFGPTSYDREMADVFLVQDEIVSQIVAKVAGGYGAIERAEVNSAARKSPSKFRPTILSCARAVQFSSTGPKTRFARPKTCCVKPSCSTRPTHRHAANSLGSA